MKGSEPMPNSVREPIPHLSTKGGTTQLIVDGRPFLIIGGELHNSSSSSLGYMEPIWERLVTLQLNTVLAAISWELVEPYEGSFDWTIVDGLIQAARRHNLRLILLWFGSWKNGSSSYVPLWVKQNYYRFPAPGARTARPWRCSQPLPKPTSMLMPAPSPPCCAIYARLTVKTTQSSWSRSKMRWDCWAIRAIVPT